MGAPATRVGATRAVLGVTALARALLWAAAVAALSWSAVGLLDWAVGLPLAARRAAPVLAASLGAVAGLIALWRAGAVWSRAAVALWIEERTPALRYSLVTAIERVPRAEQVTLELGRVISHARWGGAVAAAVGRALAAPVVVTAIAAATGLMLPRGIVARITTPRVGDVLARPAAGFAGAGHRLAPLVAIITPPQYTGLPSTTTDNPSRIGALSASSVQVEGRGDPGGLIARLGDGPLQVTGADGRWHVIFAMPARPAALRMRDGASERLIALEPRLDSAPLVTLGAPAADTVVPGPTGTLRLEARATDDFGLVDFWLEYIVSSGEGEAFTFRSGLVRRMAVHGARRGVLTAPLRLDSLGIKPGDVVHVRAVATDGNLAAGPDTGLSETRTIRVARAGEFDSVAVEPAPPPAAAQSEASERMLIQRAESLERRRASLPRATLLGEATRLAQDQGRVRRRVGGLVFARLVGRGGVGHDQAAEESGDTLAPSTLTPDELLRAANASTNIGARALDFEGDETPVVAASRPLLEAYNAMWDAERALGVGDVRGALPYMYLALAAVERARQAERLYLRGGAVAAIVDVARVRLSASVADAAPAPRAPRAGVGDVVRRARRLDAALAALSAHPAAAADSLLLLRLDVLDTNAPLANALGVAVDALRSGRDATAALAAARRLAAGGLAAGGGATRAASPEWSGAW